MTTSSPAIIDFSSAVVAEDVSSPAADRVLAGNPVQSVRNLFADGTGQFNAGTWASSPGCWQVRYTENEFCHVLEGKIRITSADGTTWLFGVGNSFVVPAGFAGIWEVIEPARKLYAIFESR